MNISIKDLGSKNLHQQVIDDIEELVSQAHAKSFIPFILVVGPLFLEVATAQYLIKEDKISNWIGSYSSDYKTLSELFKKKKLDLYTLCLKNNGSFGTDKERKLDIFFDPDETYLKLKCVDINTKSGDNTNVTAQGHPIYVLRFSPEDILPDYLTDLN